MSQHSHHSHRTNQSNRSSRPPWNDRPIDYERTSTWSTLHVNPLPQFNLPSSSPSNPLEANVPKAQNMPMDSPTNPFGAGAVKNCYM